jgi:hypothetical protein
MPVEQNLFHGLKDISNSNGKSNSFSKKRDADTPGQTPAMQSYLDRLVNHPGVNMMAEDRVAKGVS